VIIELGTPSGCALSASIGFGTILDDDPALIALAWASGTTGGLAGTSDPGAWALGALATGAVRTTHAAGTDPAIEWRVENLGEGTARLTATAGASGPWSIAAAAGSNACELGVAANGATGYTSLDATTSPAGVVLADTPAGSVQSVDVRLRAPTATTAGGSTATLTITITGSEP
jgi:hypothetical protein